MTGTRDPETYALIGAAMEVHRVVGPGMKEIFYQLAFAEELRLREIPFQRERPFGFVYKGVLLNTEVQPDFIAFADIVVELKAMHETTDMERSQIINYLRATGFRRGLLLNFGPAILQFERFVSDPHHAPGVSDHQALSLPPRRSVADDTPPQSVTSAQSVVEKRERRAS